MPGIEDGRHSSLELLTRIFGEVLAGAFLNQRLESSDHFAEVILLEAGIVFHLGLGLGFIQNHLVRIVVLASFGFHFHHNAPVHLKKTSVGVPRKFCITGLLGKGLNNFVINPEIENGVHHTGHRLTRTGTDRKQKGILEITKFFAHGLFDLGNICLNLGIESLGVFLTVVVIISANFSGDRETSRNGNSNAAHFGKIGALTA